MTADSEKIVFTAKLSLNLGITWLFLWVPSWIVCWGMLEISGVGNAIVPALALRGVLELGLSACAVVFGIIGIRRIGKSPVRLGGKKRAVFGIAIGGIGLIVEVLSYSLVMHLHLTHFRL